MVLKHMVDSFNDATTKQAAIDAPTVLDYIHFVDYPSLIQALKELPDNSYSHGKATKFGIDFIEDKEGNLQQIVVFDNGCGLISDGDEESTKHFNSATGLKKNDDYGANNIGHHGAGLLQVLVKYTKWALFISKHGVDYHVCHIPDSGNLERSFMVIKPSHERYAEIDDDWNNHNSGETQGLVIILAPKPGTWEDLNLKEMMEMELSITYTDRFKIENKTMDIFVNGNQVALKSFEDFVDIDIDEEHTFTWTEKGQKISAKVRLRAGKIKTSVKGPFRMINIALGGRQISQDSSFGIFALRSKNQYNYAGMAIHLDFPESLRLPLGVPPTKWSSFQNGADDSSLTRWLETSKRGPNLKKVVEKYCSRKAPEPVECVNLDDWKSDINKILNAMTKRATFEPHEDLVGITRRQSPSAGSSSTDSSNKNNSEETSPQNPSRGTSSRRQKYAVELSDLKGKGKNPYFEADTINGVFTITFDTSQSIVRNAFFLKQNNGAFKKKDGNYVLRTPDIAARSLVVQTISLAQTMASFSGMETPSGETIDDFAIRYSQSMEVKTGPLNELKQMVAEYKNT